MTGCDERENICANLNVAKRSAGLGIARLKQQCKNIAWSIVGIRCEAPLTHRNNVVDSFLEEPKRRLQLHARWPWHDRRQTQNIEWIDASKCIEIRRHRSAHLIRIAPEAVRENGALQHIHRNARRLV